MVKKKAMDFCVKEWTLRLRWKKWKRWGENGRREEGRWLKVRVLWIAAQFQFPLLHLPQICAFWMSITNMAESWLIWTQNPYWLTHAELHLFCFFQICETSRNEGLKRNQATVSCWSSQQSYLVWACHLSGQWMHEIREGEEEENVSTTAGEGDKGERDFGVGMWGWGWAGGGGIKLGRKTQNIEP